MKGEMTLNNDK